MAVPRLSATAPLPILRAMDRDEKRRIDRGLAWGALALAAFIASGLLLTDHLTPPATGAPSRALATQPAQTEIDRELAPLLAARPGQTGVILVPDGLDAFAMRAIATQKAGRSLDLQYYIWHDDLIRLAGPELSYWLYHSGDGGLRWLDRAHSPPEALPLEPDTRAWQRGLVRVLGWLPIESQL